MMRTWQRRCKSMHTRILALVKPGSLTIVGLQSITYKEQTYHHVSAGHARLATQSRADAAHLQNTHIRRHISPHCQTEKLTFPEYPVSSLSSRTAACSGDSPSSIRPAGNSTQKASTGGRYCTMIMVLTGLLGCLRIGTMATASTPVDLRVLRAAASQIRCLPSWNG